MTTKSEREMRAIRKNMQIVFQDPFSSLHPRRRIRDIVAEPLIIHGMRTRRGARRGARAARAGQPVGGRRRQVPARVLRRTTPAHRHRPRALARTRSCSSSTSRCRRSTSASRPACSACSRSCATSSTSRTSSSPTTSPSCGTSPNRTAVMYLGKIVELGDVVDVFERPTHPYTKALLSAAPIPDPHVESGTGADRAHRRRPQSEQPAERLPLPHPLLARRGALPQRGTAPDRPRRRAPGRVPLPARGRRRGTGADGRGHADTRPTLADAGPSTCATADVRRDLVAAYRRMLDEGLIQGTAGNVSVRTARGMLITPSSLDPAVMNEQPPV